MSDIAFAAIAVITVVVALRSAYGLGKAAGMVEVKFPLRGALEAFGLYLSHATEAIKPMSKEARDEIGLTCQAQLETDLVALRNKLSEAGLDVYLAKHGATASTSSR